MHRTNKHSSTTTTNNTSTSLDRARLARVAGGAVGPESPLVDLEALSGIVGPFDLVISPRDAASLK